jgi:DNA polymerase/3'-5' exonuclease PolX
MEGFRSANDVKRHMDALSEEQRKILKNFDEIEKAGSIPREEVQEYVQEIEKVIKNMFEGANEVFEVTPCGSYRRNEPEIKELDILITSKKEEPTRFMLLKLVEMLEDQGII